MSISEKLKKTKKALVAGALTMAAVAAPIKGQSAEATPEKEPAKIVEVSKAQKDRQQLFERAVRAGASKEEIAKYMDFPEFLPVDKNGQFDDKKAEEWAQKLAPYMKTLAEKGQTMSAADAYKIFKETTGQKDVSLKDFEQLCKIAQDATRESKNRRSDIPFFLIGVPLCLAVAFATGKFALNAGKEGVDCARSHSSGTVFTFGVASASALFSLIATTATVKETYGLVDALRTTPKRTVSQIYSRMYDTYVDNTIKAQQKQFQQMEWEQVKKTLGAKTN